MDCCNWLVAISNSVNISAILWWELSMNIVFSFISHWNNSIWSTCVYKNINVHIDFPSVSKGSRYDSTKLLKVAIYCKQTSPPLGLYVKTKTFIYNQNTWNKTIISISVEFFFLLFETGFPFKGPTVCLTFLSKNRHFFLLWRGITL